MEDTDHYRCRLIYLRPDADLSKQAKAACDKLAGIEGILLAAPADQHSIRLIYSLDHLSFELVVDLLDELGFDMDDSILLTLKKTIYCFLDTNARENMHIDVTQFEKEPTDTPDVPQQSSEKYWEDYH